MTIVNDGAIEPACLPGVTPLRAGTKVQYFGDYEIHRPLGRGGMGMVYLARQISLNRTVALKLVRTGILDEEAEVRRFRNEAEAIALLDHPGIVKIFEVGSHGHQRFLSMQLLEGGTLSDRLNSYRVDFEKAARFVIEAAGAIQHAHMRGILHRDLKPSNVLIDSKGKPCITDFGLAKFMKAENELTASGEILGTPSYMSPEQAAGNRGSITVATDVYGLGTIHYAMLTGSAPFSEGSVVGTLDAVRHQPPVSPRKRNAEVPRDLELICLKCLEKNPEERYLTAEALADDLNRWVAGEPVSLCAPAPSNGSPNGHAASRRWQPHGRSGSFRFRSADLARRPHGTGGPHQPPVISNRWPERMPKPPAMNFESPMFDYPRPEPWPPDCLSVPNVSNMAGPSKSPSRNGKEIVPEVPANCLMRPGRNCAAGNGITSTGSAIRIF